MMDTTSLANDSSISLSSGTTNAIDINGESTVSIISTLTIFSITVQDAGSYTCSLPGTSLIETISLNINNIIGKGE